ncbi:helix-turn-helix transcriptional regulator [Streptomyces sp. NPDC003077]|uniref:helix-turn-helix transcriptional regulator n=1 Tax=Streptomyces sp. NPDC003077 TaxID=3154443 RepID=UPI0033A475D6
MNRPERGPEGAVDDLVALRPRNPGGDREFMTADPRALIDMPTSVDTYASFFDALQIVARTGEDTKELLDLETACARMHEVAAECGEEVVAMMPGGGRPVAELFECGPPVLGQGIRTRLLLQHTARFDSAAREQAEALIGAGAEIRTVAPLFEQLIIFDARTAFIPAADADRDAVAVIRDPTVVTFLHACFGRAWAGAMSYAPRLGELSAISDDLKDEILRMLINGAKDDTIARRLGLSVRTCRKYVAQLMRKYRVATRFQLGYAVCRGMGPAGD